MCVFCKIVNGEIPSFKIYESDHALAFLDISQNTVGHTLVIPKKHFENIFELDSETGKEIFDAVLKTTQILKNKLDILLEREHRKELAQSCFNFLVTRGKLDLLDFDEPDIFSH